MIPIRIELRYALAVFLSLLFLGLAELSAQELKQLRVGHWITVRGKLMEDGRFIADQLDLGQPEPEEQLIGTVEAMDTRGTWAQVLQQRVTLSDRTKYRKLIPGKILGERVKVEGHYRNLSKFSGRALSLRGSGRDRISGRIDAIHQGEQGLEFDLMRYRVVTSESTKFKREDPIASYSLAPPRPVLEEQDDAYTESLIVRTDFDYLPGSFEIAKNLRVGLRAEISRDTERDFDLDGGTDEDRIDDEFSLRAVGNWTPSEQFFMRFGGRFTKLWRQDEADGRSEDAGSSLTELYAYWSRIYAAPVDLQVGRQDYYDEREWLWDENLDALRLFYYPGSWIFELAAATTLSSGSPREEETDRMILSVTHHWADRSLGAYLIDQRTKLSERDYPLFMGLRAYGEWFEDHNSWAEFSLVRGYVGSTDIRGWALDLGSTWFAPGAEPWYFSAGYALGSGDGDNTDGVDHAYRQTGIQDNNDKFGGVTSFKYYGELLEPELSNLHILTAGVGRRLGKRISMDLVYHLYRQDEAFNRLRDTNLDARPNGNARGIGQELDLIFGHRASNGLDTEVVLSTFDPGNAFDEDRRAYLVKLQFRYRLR